MKPVTLGICALMGLLVACSSVVPRPPVDRNVLPQRFSVSIGGFTGPSYKVNLEGDHLVYQAMGAGWHPQNTKRLHPSSEDWQHFWRAADKVELWRWRTSYKPRTVCPDGTSWEVELAFNDKHVHSVGLEAYPGNADPRSTVEESAASKARFDQFTQAVSKLIGGREFR